MDILEGSLDRTGASAGSGHDGAALVRMARDSGAVRGQQIYVLAAEARLTHRAALHAGDFSGPLTRTIEVSDSPTRCFLLVLATRGAVAQGAGR